MNNQEKWIHYKRGGVYFGRLYSGVIGYKNLYSQYFNIPLGEFFYYTNARGLDWCLERKWVFKLGDALIEDLLKNNAQGKKFRKEWKILYHRVKALSHRIIFKVNLKKLSQEKLKTLYWQLFDVMCHFHSLSGMGIDALDESLFLRMRHELKKKIRNKEKFEHIFQVLNTPTETTFAQKRDLAILALARRMQQKGDGMRRSSWQEEIETIVNEFWWTTLGWMPGKKLSAIQVKKEIKKYLKDDSLAKRHLHYKDFSQAAKQSKNKMLKTMHASQRFRDLIQIFEEVAIYRDQRKETQLYMMEAQDQILKEIIHRRPGLKFSEIAWLKAEEALDYLAGAKGLEQIVDQRKQHTICYVRGQNKFIMTEGAEAGRLRDALIQKKPNQEIRTFKGMPASPGKVRGRVIVSNDPNYLNRHIKRGEILVASQTTPDFVPAMKRAAAIVTEEGGATSHAAIISRELKIPCVVATKIATQVLKDGDQVSVDAARGIVKIIKKTK